MLIDAKGKACPMPVVMAKKALDGGAKTLAVAVDNRAAVENLTRLAGEYGRTLAVTEEDGAFLVQMLQGGAPAEAAGKTAAAPAVHTAPQCGSSGCGYAVFVGKDHIGEGAEELGYNLMKMALYTLAESDDVPASVLFMNSGVKLPAGGEAQIVESLQKLMGKGTEVLVCGTCLNYYGIADQLKAGMVSNMYDILNRMQRAAKVITL